MVFFLIRVFEAFAGYGTSTFALKQLGIEHELVGFSEIDKYAVKCFQQNHGGKNFGDITKINWSEVPDFDLLTGGFPCQSFSTAGKQLGEQDTRGQLGLELTRALIAKQPKYFLFENVKGFMSKRFKETREKFVKSWEEAGYNVTYKVLNTKDFGVPQNRERVWFVGIRHDLFKDYKFPEPFELKLKLKDVLESDVNEKFFLSENLLTKLKEKVKPRDISFCVTAGTKGTKFGGKPSWEMVKIQGCAVRAWPRTGSSDEGREQRLELNGKEEANSISSVQKDSLVVVHNLQSRSADRPSVVKALSEGKPAPGGSGHLMKADGTTYCLDAGNTQAIELYHNCLTEAIGRQGSSKEFIQSCKSLGFVRRLTPKECFRLQGFLEDEVNLEGLSDTQKYRLAGNGQSVNVVKLIFKELFK